ncbi:hypothetical protein SDC9_140689 [bioreactor metagenome]|uniref:Uncharacterized protein n=1 Tax=bioreactor metagenome TaxID=1076179 RepID=A0A645DVL1_9ZZZZ
MEVEDVPVLPESPPDRSGVVEEEGGMAADRRRGTDLLVRPGSQLDDLAALVPASRGERGDLDAGSCQCAFPFPPGVDDSAVEDA